MAVKSSFQAVVARINATNGLALNSTDVYIKQIVPTTVDEQAAHGGANTKALVAAMPDNAANLSGEQWVFYNRLNLASVIPDNTAGVALKVSGIYWASDLYSDLNTAHGLSLRPRDLRSDSLGTAGSNVDKTITLSADPLSVGYIGSVGYKFNRMGGTSIASGNGNWASFSPGKVGVSYSNIINATGPNAPYTAVTVTSGQLPPGLTLAIINTTTGSIRLSGTPTAAGVYTFTMQLTATVGGPTSQTRTVVIAQASTSAWSTSKLSNMLLSADGFRAYRGSTAAIGDYGACLSDFTLDGRRSYLEFAVELSDGGCNLELGLATSAFDYTALTPPSASAEAFVVQQLTGAFATNGQLKAMMSVPAAYEVAFRNNYFLQMAVDATDMSQVKVWFGRSNAWSGNPATGTNPAVVFDATGKNLYALLAAARPAYGVQGAAYLRVTPGMLYQASNVPAGFSCPYAS